MATPTFSLRLARPATLLLGATGALAALVLFCFDPRQYHIYPLCLFHATTGLLCPGCGGLRALHQLLHGHLLMAFHFNPMLVLCLPVLIWVAAALLWQRIKKQPFTLPLGALWLWLILAVVLVISVLRNIPWEGFALLRPLA